VLVSAAAGVALSAIEKAEDGMLFPEPSDKAVVALVKYA
jgi:hypothetical protein